MKLTIVGSADAFNSSGRGHSCYLLESPGCGAVMVDFGATALAGLRRAGRELNELSALAFTHLHGDHIGGFPFLLIDVLFNSQRQTALPVLGPALTRKALEEIVQATYGDVKDELARFPLPIEEFLPGEERSLSGFRVQAFAADHMQPPHRPLCLRFTDPAGTSIAFSGDTRVCDGLFAAADGVDLLVAECTRLHHPAGSHCTWDDWRIALPQVRARAVLFTHLGADVRDSIPALLTERGLGVPFSFADDKGVLEL